jgi:hypothetical protein
VRGLVRLCRLSKVLERYRTRMMDTLKVVVKTVMLEYLELADYCKEEVAEGGQATYAGGGPEVRALSLTRHTTPHIISPFHTTALSAVLCVLACR